MKKADVVLYIGDRTEGPNGERISPVTEPLHSGVIVAPDGTMMSDEGYGSLYRHKWTDTPWLNKDWSNAIIYRKGAGK